MIDVEVIENPAAATVALDPVRSVLLAELSEPASASQLALRVGIARQKVNYHLHALEKHGLVQLAQERMWGGLTERLLVATAFSYVVSASALGPVAVDPSREIDRLSASYLIALGARVVHEVGDLVRRAKEAGKRLASWFSVEHNEAQIVSKEPGLGVRFEQYVFWVNGMMFPIGLTLFILILRPIAIGLRRVKVIPLQSAELSRLR